MSVQYPAWLPWALAVSSLAFGAGHVWGESRASQRWDLLAERLAGHERLPIHPGAASSEIVRMLEARIERLQSDVDGLNRESRRGVTK